VIVAAAAKTKPQPSRIIHQSQRCERDVRDGLSKFVVIARFSPVWIAPELAVNDRYTRDLATGLSDPVVHVAAHRIVVAGGKVGVVGVQALHTARRATDSPAWPMARPSGNEGVPLRRVAGVQRLELDARCRIGVELGLGGANSALPLDARDPTTHERTGQPIERGKRHSGVENRRNLGDDRQV